jgi:outer membrane protein assembly factor BamB
VAQKLREISVAGMKHDGRLLWLAVPEQRQVATYDPATGKVEERLTYVHEVWDVSPAETGLWLLTAGGKLDRQIVFWSFAEDKPTRTFSCPEGAAAGATLLDGKLWLTHRNNRKLYCLDPETGKTNWVIKTENETFSPAAFRHELWMIESEPGPLAHWGEKRHGKYFFSRYDPARELVVERLPVDFIPACMAYDGERFWYAESDKNGIASTEKNFRQL